MAWVSNFYAGVITMTDDNKALLRPHVTRIVAAVLEPCHTRRWPAN
jgi:hypothetical protein